MSEFLAGHPVNWECASCGAPAWVEEWPAPCAACGNRAIIGNRVEMHRFTAEQVVELAEAWDKATSVSDSERSEAPDDLEPAPELRGLTAAHRAAA